MTPAPGAQLLPQLWTLKTLTSRGLHSFCSRRVYKLLLPLGGCRLQQEGLRADSPHTSLQPIPAPGQGQEVTAGQPAYTRGRSSTVAHEVKISLGALHPANTGWCLRTQGAPEPSAPAHSDQVGSPLSLGGRAQWTVLWPRPRPCSPTPTQGGVDPQLFSC